MTFNTARKTLPALALGCLFFPSTAAAQVQAPKPKSQTPRVPKIPDQPRTVDPARFVPQALSASVTVKFEETSLRAVGEWVQKQRKIPVLFDKKALAAAGIPLGEPVTDRLNNEPVYLLLNRLRSLGVSWYVRDNVLHITTLAVARDRMSTEPYNVGDLLDAGYKRDNLLRTVRAAVRGPWVDVEGRGGKVEWLGDVLFVRQSDAVHREVRGLLAALRKHGRQTFTLDPPQHASLRDKLDKNASVSFDEIPLAMALRQLGEKTGTDIRLDIPALRKTGVHERQPVTLKLSDRKLEAVLRVLLADLGLTYVLRDGVLSITSVNAAEEQLKTAAYDVRDLCRNEREAAALKQAIQNQTQGPWIDSEGIGGTITFARPGTMVIRQTEHQLNQVGSLLGTYRKALRASKPRERAEEKSREIVTRYYRMHEAVAGDLLKLLPKMVQPETWKSDATPEAPGTVMKVASQPGLLDAGKTVATNGGGLLVPRAVLIIRQRRSVHEKIGEVIQRIEQGDAPLVEPAGGLGGGGLGGGGFGGGFFSVR